MFYLTGPKDMTSWDYMTVLVKRWDGMERTVNARGPGPLVHVGHGNRRPRATRLTIPRALHRPTPRMVGRAGLAALSTRPFHRGSPSRWAPSPGFDEALQRSHGPANSTMAAGVKWRPTTRTRSSQLQFQDMSSP